MLIFSLLSIEKETDLKNEIEISDRLRDAYEKLLQKVNKKKRNVGVGSHDVWHDPEMERLQNQFDDSEREVAMLKQELDKMKKQRDVCF